MKMKEPRTRAGKSLLGSQIQTVEAILAVEDEAEAQARPAGASELRAALELLDPIIRHVESWPPAGDSFLDDLRTIRAALASDAGSVPIHNHDGGEPCVTSRCPAARSVGALDVERLARAYHIEMAHGGPYPGVCHLRDTVRAQGLAAAYDAERQGEDAVIGAALDNELNERQGEKA